jgi:hypothetical protein
MVWNHNMPLSSPFNWSFSTVGFREGAQGSVDARLPSAARVELSAIAGWRRDPCIAPVRERRQVRALGRTPCRGSGNGAG